MYTQLILAEKPSQAMDLAKAIGLKSRSDGYLELTNGGVVTWAIGHLLYQANPDAYSEDWGGAWKWSNLPMIPQQWKYVENDKTKKQLKTVVGLLKKTQHVIIATDAGREGELIAREVLEYAKYKGKISRLWTSSLVEKDIKKAYANLLPGAHTEPLFEAARARAHSDWILGLSGTRAATLAAGVRGTAFPLGRVKTPTLAMVYRRHKEITEFGAREYFELEALVQTKAGATLKMLHAPSAENRITSKEAITALMEQARGYTGPLKVVASDGSEKPPLPYSLPALQKDANKVLGLSAKETLKLAQTLYEKKVTTYPRTDCQYLASSQVAEIAPTLKAVEKTLAQKVRDLNDMGVITRGSLFDDTKLTDHHAIVPTIVAPADLSSVEMRLYCLIAERYLMALAPDHEFISTKVTLNANGVEFKATGRTTKKKGWTALKSTS